MKKCIIILTMILFPLGVSADIFLDNATVIGDLKEHDKVASFAMPPEAGQDSQSWNIGYRFWINEYQMTVLIVNVQEDLSCTSCRIFEGALYRDCDISELSTTLYHMPEITLKELNQYWND